MEDNSNVVKSLIMGIGALVIVTIVVLIIVSTMIDANLLRSADKTSTTTNELGYINQTGYTLANFDSLNRNYAITIIKNVSATIGSGNYTFDSTTGLIRNKTEENWDNASITYTYILESNYEKSVDNMGSNATAGIRNVSKQIPTILLIGAVVLLFGIILYLVRQSQAMGFNGSAQL